MKVYFVQQDICVFLKSSAPHISHPLQPFHQQQAAMVKKSHLHHLLGKVFFPFFFLFQPFPLRQLHLQLLGSHNQLPLAELWRSSCAAAGPHHRVGN